ncbi:MAG: hypothetical protein SPK72_00235 [Bacteroidales bacterium]|nr:hypothetical protein [Bacteroidales bacterium]
MKKLSFILLFCIMSLIGTRCPAQVTFLSGSTEADTIVVGQPFDYKLLLNIPSDYFVEWLQLGDTLSGSIDVINASEVKTTPASNGNNVLMEQHLTLTSFDTGYVYVPELCITYSKSLQDSIRHTLYTDEAELYVTTVAVDTTQAFRPIKGVMRQGLTAKEVFPWVGLFVILAGIAYLIYRHSKNKNAKEPAVVEKKKPVIPAIVTARAKLAEMKDNELWTSAKTKDYYTDLTDIAREYLEGQFEIDAVEMTTDEIMQEVNGLNLNAATKEKLRETLVTADFVKFAKANPTAEQNKQSFVDINSFVEDSYVFFKEEEEKKKEEQQ